MIELHTLTPRQQEMLRELSKRQINAFDQRTSTVLVKLKLAKVVHKKVRQGAYTRHLEITPAGNRLILAAKPAAKAPAKKRAA